MIKSNLHLKSTTMYAMPTLLLYTWTSTPLLLIQPFKIQFQANLKDNAQSPEILICVGERTPFSTQIPADCFPHHIKIRDFLIEARERPDTTAECSRRWGLEL